MTEAFLLCEGSKKGKKQQKWQEERMTQNPKLFLPFSLLFALFASSS
jgi:hypothetical protein